MTSAARVLPTPAPVALPGRRDATGAVRGVGLTVVEGPTTQQRVDRWWAAYDRRHPAPSQLTGELAILGMVTEALAWPMVNGDLLTFVLANMGALGALILGQLAHRERQKRARIAARQAKGAPTWA